jgi:hypothetical protein
VEIGHDLRMAKTHSLRDAYRHPGFVPSMKVGVEGDAPEAYVLPLHRRQKKRVVASVVFSLGALTTTSSAALAIWIAVVTRSILSLNSVASIVRGVV